MKKIFALLFAVTMTVAVNAQTAATVTFDMKSASYSQVNDTVTNTGSAQVIINFFKIWDYISVTPIVTKISGTLTANSTAKLQGSVDGTNWFAVNAADTLHIVNQTTNTTSWIVTSDEANPYAYLRVYYPGAGTMVATLRAKICLKNK